MKEKRCKLVHQVCQWRKMNDKQWNHQKWTFQRERKKNITIGMNSQPRHHSALCSFVIPLKLNITIYDVLAYVPNKWISDIGPKIKSNEYILRKGCLNYSLEGLPLMSSHTATLILLGPLYCQFTRYRSRNVFPTTVHTSINSEKKKTLRTHMLSMSVLDF